MAPWRFDEQHKIRTISTISSLINSSLDIQEVLNNSLAAVEHFIEVENSSIFQLDADTGELFFCCARGAGAKKIAELRLKVGEGIAGWVAQTEQPLIVTDVTQDPRFLSAFDAITGFTTRSILGIPLKAKGRLIGVLELLNKKDGTEFNEEDLDIMKILANQIATALENARLYKKVHEKLHLTVEELKFTQGKLLRSERLAALGKLAQGVAHEVRNPVAIIGGLAHLIQRKIPATDPTQELLGEINAAVHRLEAMVREIETFAQMPALRLAPADLAGILEEVASVFAEPFASAGISLEVHLPVDLPPIPVDAARLGQVLHLLFENSLEAMPLGGKLSLSVALETKCVKISLQDTGLGIPSETLPLIFDPFFSTKAQGNGMGLTIVHRIISEHKGEIHICSTAGVGTTVDLHLPRWPSE